MLGFRKYEKTFRIAIPQYPNPGGALLSEEDTKRLLSSPVYITEKIDGANGAIHILNGVPVLQKRGGVISTGEHPQYGRFKEWFASSMYDFPWDSLLDGTVIYGEIMYCVHSIYYDALPDWFLVFAIWSDDRYLIREEVELFCKEFKLHPVPLLAKNKFEIEDLYDIIPYRSKLGSGMAEGIVVWNYKEGIRGKVVKPEFIKIVDESDHWTKGEIRYNKVLI